MFDNPPLLFDHLTKCIMALNNTFRGKITSLIDETLIPHGISNPEFSKKIWDYHYDDDFKYGQKAGLAMGLILGYYIAKFPQRMNYWK